MNWTAILALSVIAVTMFVQHFALRDANERADQAWKRVDEYAKARTEAFERCRLAELREQHVGQQLDHLTKQYNALLVRQQNRRSRRSDRAQGTRETDNGF